MEHSHDDITPRHAEPPRPAHECIFEGCTRYRRYPETTCRFHQKMVERVRADIYPGGYDTSKFSRKR